MYRWHESGCRRPDVSTASGLPCCSYCFAIPSLEDLTVHREPCPVPKLHDRRRMNLSWPAAVTYSDWDPGNESGVSQSDINRGLPEPELPKSFLPELPSEDSIRLLRLKPGTDGDPIHVDLETVHINQIPLPLYDALSYTSVNDLTDSSEPCPVFIGSYWDVAYVSTTCGKALRRLRRRKSDRLLWIDSLCINQTKPVEKNGQVYILREIYARATKVVAYVGDEPPDSGPAFSFLKEITAFQPTPGNYPAIDKSVQDSVSALLKLPYFSRLWVLQETLMAREIELICGVHSVRWPKRAFGGSCSGLNIPTWLFKDSKWYPFTGRDLLNVLVDASAYQCSDPRDKVFAVLGLMGEKFISPDYRLATENVYIGIAAYFAKSWDTMDFLALAGQTDGTDLPSWVPDWSQKLSLPSLDTVMQAWVRGEPDDLLLEDAIPVWFEGLGSNDRDMEVNSATGTMRLQGSKLCSIKGERRAFEGYTYIVIPTDTRGVCVLSIPHPNYEIDETDRLFVLNGYRYPVILRKTKRESAYILVSVCALSIRSPTSTFLVPWYQRGRRDKPSGLNVSALGPEENGYLQQLYSRLEPMPPGLGKSLPSVTTVRARVLTFLMLYHPALERIERQLREDWIKWNQELGWMFRDQSAIWQFLLEVNQMSSDQRTGEGKMEIKRPDFYSVSQTGRKYPSVYTWDLSRFCWSFLQPTDTTESEPELQWSPMVDRLRSHLSEIQQWAQATERLLKHFEYTATCLGESWESFPGTQLPRRWADNHERFLAALGPHLHHHGTDIQRRPHLVPEYLWRHSEFESQLRARQEIWTLRGPEGYSGGSNVEVHALLHFLGLDLYNEQRIGIV